jgi:hypothetical protein
MINEYPLIWKDMQLPTGQKFAVAVCGYCNKVRHMMFGNDPLRRMIFTSTNMDENGNCMSAEHCLALDCPLNKTEQEHILHMLDMNEDDEVDEETANQWNAKTISGCFVSMAHYFSEHLE